MRGTFWRRWSWRGKGTEEAATEDVSRPPVFIGGSGDQRTVPQFVSLLKQDSILKDALRGKHYRGPRSMKPS